MRVFAPFNMNSPAASAKGAVVAITLDIKSDFCGTGQGLASITKKPGLNKNAV
jgi:hypothetical protein